MKIHTIVFVVFCFNLLKICHMLLLFSSFSRVKIRKSASPPIFCKFFLLSGHDSYSLHKEKYVFLRKCESRETNMHLHGTYMHFNSGNWPGTHKHSNFARPKTQSTASSTSQSKCQGFAA